MKNLGKAFATVFALGMIGFSLMPQPSQDNVAYNTELNALSVAGSSSAVGPAAPRGKAWCDGSNWNSCTISIPDGTILNGEGQPRAEW